MFPLDVSFYAHADSHAKPKIADKLWNQILSSTQQVLVCIIRLVFSLPNKKRKSRHHPVQVGFIAYPSNKAKLSLYYRSWTSNFPIFALLAALHDLHVDLDMVKQTDFALIIFFWYQLPSGEQKNTWNWLRKLKSNSRKGQEQLADQTPLKVHLNNNKSLVKSIVDG